MAGIVWLEAIRDALADEAARKTSVEARGAGVITTSGGIVTLLFGLIALLTKPAGYVLPELAIIPLGLAVVAFGAAILLALASFRPRVSYTVTLVSEFRDKVNTAWAADDHAARQAIALTYVGQLEAARKANDGKATLLTAAMVAQVIGILAIGSAVAMILASA